MDKFFRVEVSNFALSRFFLSRTLFSSPFCVFIMHTWLMVMLGSCLHSVFTIVVVRRGRENLIFAEDLFFFFLVFLIYRLV